MGQQSSTKQYSSCCVYSRDNPFFGVASGHAFCCKGYSAPGRSEKSSSLFDRSVGDVCSIADPLEGVKRVPNLGMYDLRVSSTNELWSSTNHDQRNAICERGADITIDLRSYFSDHWQAQRTLLQFMNRFALQTASPRARRVT